MARKSTTLLKSAEIKLPMISKRAIEATENMFIPDGVDLAVHRRHVDALKALEEQYVICDRLGAKINGFRDKGYDKFIEAQRTLSIRQSQVFSTYEGLAHAIKHANDVKYAAQEEVRATISESLTDKVDEIQFNINIGLLGSNVAQAIRNQVVEVAMDDIPLCEDCG